jgi:hypothetical protein
MGEHRVPDRLFRRIVAAFATAALCGAWVEPPPAKYDHAPSAPIVVRYETGAVFKVFCRAMFMTIPGRVAACAPPHAMPRKCLIVIDREFRKDRAALIRHERAHCNGWRH